MIFISISSDKDRKKWIQSVRSGAYTSDLAYNLYTEGKGSSHPVLNKYYVESYPKAALIDRSGSIRTIELNALGGGNEPNPKKLIESIELALQE